MLKSWYDIDLYHETLRRNEGKPLLHPSTTAPRSPTATCTWATP